MDTEPLPTELDIDPTSKQGVMFQHLINQGYNVEEATKKTEMIFGDVR